MARPGWMVTRLLLGRTERGWRILEVGSVDPQGGRAQGDRRAEAGRRALRLKPGQFLSPQGLACGPDGEVLVADTGNHRVQVLKGIRG